MQDIPLPDGLYRVVTNYFVAGFIIEGGNLVSCAPILRRNFKHWTRIAEWII